MKFLWIVLLSLLVGSSSFAYKMNSNTMEFEPAPKDYAPKIDLEARVDLTGSSALTYTPWGAQSTVQGTTWTAQAVRPRIRGQYNDALSYTFRLNVVKLASTTNRDGTDDLLDQAYVDYKVSDFNIRVGKFNELEATGWESVYYLTDVFTYSTTFNNYNTNYGYYRTGGALSYSYGDHNFTLSCTNGSKAITDSTGTSQINNGLSYGIHYNGSFLDGVLMPIVSYTMFQMDGNANAAPTQNSTTDSLIAVGLRVAPIAHLTVDGDYDILTQPTQNTTQANNQVTTTGRVEARYGLDYGSGTFMPFVNAISDKFTGFGSTALPNSQNFSKFTYDIGLMYYPMKGTNFRYELVYSDSQQQNDTSNTATSDINSNWFRLGAKLDI